MTCTDTEYIPDLSVYIFSIMSALTKKFNTIPEKESLTLKKNATVPELEERLDQGNFDSYLLATRTYTIPNGAVKTVKDGKKLEWKTTANLEGTARTTATATIKQKTRGERKVK